MFKRFTLLTFFVLCFWGMKAQFLKGDGFIGGQILLSSIDSESTDLGGNQFKLNSL